LSSADRLFFALMGEAISNKEWQNLDSEQRDQSKAARDARREMAALRAAGPSGRK